MCVRLCVCVCASVCSAVQTRQGNWVPWSWRFASCELLAIDVRSRTWSSAQAASTRNRWAITPARLSFCLFFFLIRTWIQNIIELVAFTSLSCCYIAACGYPETKRVCWETLVLGMKVDQSSPQNGFCVAGIYGFFSVDCVEIGGGKSEAKRS